jgi:hypothetical protein
LFAGLVPYVEKRIEPEQLNKMVSESLPESDKVDAVEKKLNFRVRVSETVPIGTTMEHRYIFPLSTRETIDILTAVTVPPNSVFILKIGGIEYLKINSGEMGRVQFDSPIMIPALSYNQIEFIIIPQTNAMYELVCDGIMVLNIDDRTLLSTTTSKSAPWMFHKEMTEPVYYRSMCIPVDGSQYCF